MPTADPLQDASPIIADYVREAAKNIDRVAQDLRQYTVGDLLSMAADELYRQAKVRRQLGAKQYRHDQEKLLKMARRLVETPRRDADD